MNTHDRESVAAHYDRDYFKWQNSLGSVAGSIDAEKFTPYVAAEDSIFDFGCGGGWLLAALPGKRKLGVEVNEHARDQAARLGIEAVQSLDDVADGAYDVAISHHALEHVEAPLSVARQIFAKLRPGGTAVIVVPCERYDTKYDPGNIDQHLYTWSPVNLGNLFRHAGFEVVSVARYTHRWTPRVDLLDRYLGRSLCNVACWLHAVLRPKLAQIRLVARKPRSGPIK